MTKEILSMKSENYERNFRKALGLKERSLFHLGNLDMYQAVKL